MLFGSCEDKDCVCGRLLQRLEEGVECLLREHMDLIDDEDRVATHLRNDAHLLDQVTDIVDRVVRRSIQFVDVERAIFVECAARFALVARLGTNGVQTVYRLCKDTGASSLADTSRSAEEICVSQLTSLDSIFEGRSDMLLTDNRSEGCGTIFSCTDDKVLHNTTKVVKFLKLTANSRRNLLYLASRW